MNYKLEFRHISSILNRERSKSPPVIGVFCNAKNAQTLKEADPKLNIWIDPRRPENAIEAYLDVEDGAKLFLERCEEQNEFDEVFK